MRPVGARRGSVNFRRKSSTQSNGVHVALPASHINQDMEEMEVRGNWIESDDDDQDYYLDRTQVVDVLSGKHLTWRQRFRDVLEGQPHSNDKILHISFNVMSLAVIITSIVVFCIETLPSNVQTTAGFYITSFYVIEFICIGFFVLEIIVRVYCVPWHMLKGAFFAIDLLAVVGFIVDLAIDLTGVNAGSRGASFVRSFRLIRIFRVFKLSRHSKSLQLVFVVIRNSAAGLTSLLLPIIMIVLVSSTFIYFFEILDLTWDKRQALWMKSSTVPGQFQSIPDAIWYACVTITTVGYGDIFPDTVEGKLLGVIVAFIGVLILSFPNIVLGGNLQLAFRLHYMTQSRRTLGRKFRKVLNLIRFIHILRERAEQRALDAEQEEASPVAEVDVVKPFEAMSQPPLIRVQEGSIDLTNTASAALFRTESEYTSNSLSVPLPQLPTPSARKKMFYMMPKGEVELYRNDELPPIDHDNIRSWSFRDISAVEWLQRLLELCSGVGTTEELTSSFSTDKSPPPSASEIALIGLYLFDADYVQVFAFRRQAVNMLFCLTTAAVQELMLHKEDLHAECVRGVEMAKMVWKRTTSQPATFVLQPLQATYPQWSCAERLVDNALYTPQVDMKANFGVRGAKVRSNSTATRRSSSLAGTLATRSSNSHVVSLETAKAKMRSILEQQRELIARLQQESALFEQTVVNSYGF